jgi:hypothetical protein
MLVVQRADHWRCLLALVVVVVRSFRPRPEQKKAPERERPSDERGWRRVAAAVVRAVRRAPCRPTGSLMFFSGSVRASV